MFESLIMFPHTTDIKIGDKVKLLPEWELDKNVSEYGFELNEDINYDDYRDMELEVLEVSSESVRDDLKVVTVRVATEYEDGEQTWLYYILEVVDVKGQFEVELL